MNSSGRATKLVSLQEAVESIADGMLLAVGGVIHQNKPIGLVRAVARRHLAGLRLIGLSASGYDADLLIAAGAVAETYIPAVTFEALGLAPSFRAAVESGRVHAHGVDVASVMAGYFASAEGIPFHPVAALKGTDLLKVNPLIKPLVSPFDGTEVWAVQAITPDVALIHVQEADMYGNGRVFGPSSHAEGMLARAARRVILSCDRLVDPAVIEAAPVRTTIPGIYVSAVVHLPFGAHPTSSPGLYRPDRAHIAEYWQSAEQARRGQDAGLRAYMDQFVFGPSGHSDYLAHIGQHRLDELEEHVS